MREARPSTRKPREWATMFGTWRSETPKWFRGSFPATARSQLLLSNECRGNPVVTCYFTLAPEYAEARPSAISVAPEIFFCVLLHRKLLFSFAATPLAASAQQLSLQRPSAVNSVPRNRNCKATRPRAWSTNCGRKARKNSAVLGFRMLTTTPCPKTRRR